MLTQWSWIDPTAPEKKGLSTTSSAHRLIDPWAPPNFSPLAAIEVVGLSQSFIDEHATIFYWAHNSSM
jgi:hypothetical protein